MFANTLRHLVRVAAVLAIVALSGCSKSSSTASNTSTDQSSAPSTQSAPATAPELQVSHIELGRNVDTDKRVTDATSTFTPKETIYLSVVTNGAATDASVKARWTYQDGQVVDETTQHISPTGPAATEFHISKPNGWPAGKYNVEVWVNDKPAGSESFEVKTS